jgi:pSer/pThr/pTyr-binding forkhead associated (FHA) protein
MHLLAITGPDKGRSFPINEGCALTVGRSHTHSEIILQDTDVARVHCQVALEGDQLLVTDLDGTASTFVNELAVDEYRMKAGDVLRVGKSQLKLQKQETVIPGAIVGPRPIPVVTARPVPQVTPARAIPTVAPRPVPQVVPRSSPLASTLSVKGQTEGTVNLPCRLEELSGTTLGHFEIGPVLGKGHTGAVFRARDLKTHRTVALRILPAEFPKNDAEHQRFVQGVKSMLSLDHAHVVKLYGAGHAGAHHWLSSEYVQGQNLAQIMEQGRPEGDAAWKLAHRIALHISRGLQYAHEHQFVHRNITPTDILVHAGDNQAKLNDLVMFKALEGSGLRQVTLRAKVATELVYFSPEQTYGNQPVDHRADIFSLGSVVYAVLMGRSPFAGDSQADTIRRIREEPPASPRKLHPLLPRLFESILLKMLAKAPEFRFQTAGELVTALEQIKHSDE